MPYKFNESRRHKIPTARYRVTNWPEYDAALVRRGSLTVWFTEEAVAAWHAAATGERGSQPIYSALAIETGLALRLVFHQPLRQTGGLLRSIANVLEINIAIPDHTTLSCRGSGLTILPRRIERAEPLHLLVDSTGLKIYGEGEWLDQKHGIRSRRRWRKLHIGMDAETHEIVAVELTLDDVGDVTELPDLLNQINADIASMMADGAYDGRPSTTLSPPVIQEPRSLFRRGRRRLQMKQRLHSATNILQRSHNTGAWGGNVEPSWLLFIASGLGPFSGQAVHFQFAAPEGLGYPVNRYRREAERHYQVLDDHLAGREFIVGDSYTIADISAWGWLDRASRVRNGADDPLAPYPHLKRLFQTVDARPAVQRARAVGTDHDFKKVNDDETKRVLFPSNYPPAA